MDSLGVLVALGIVLLLFMGGAGGADGTAPYGDPMTEYTPVEQKVTPDACPRLAALPTAPKEEEKS